MQICSESSQGLRPTAPTRSWSECGVFKETRMTDNKKQTGLDRTLISLNEDYEIRDWTKSLDCSEEQLRAAVEAVGNSAEKVREYLAGKK